MATSWNGSDETGVTVSTTTASNDTATTTNSPAGDNACRSTGTSGGPKTSGKWIWFQKVLVTSAAYGGVGGANSSFDITKLPGGAGDTSGNSWVVNIGQVGFPGLPIVKGQVTASISFTNGSHPVANDILECAIDLDTTPGECYLWCRVWNSGGSAYYNDTFGIPPAPGVGTASRFALVAFGYSLGSGMLLVMGDNGTSGTSFQMLPNPTTFTDGSPLTAGFTVWDGGVTPPPTGPSSIYFDNIF